MKVGTAASSFTWRTVNEHERQTNVMGGGADVLESSVTDDISLKSEATCVTFLLDSFQ